MSHFDEIEHELYNEKLNEALDTYDVSGPTPDIDVHPNSIDDVESIDDTIVEEDEYE